MFDSVSFGKLIRKYRKQRGFTLLRLSLELNITQAYLGQIENGIKSPSIDTALNIVNFFKIGFDDEIEPSAIGNNTLKNEILNRYDFLNEKEHKFIYKSAVKFLSYAKEVEK